MNEKLLVKQFSPEVKFTSKENLNLPVSAQYVFDKNSHNTIKLAGAMQALPAKAAFDLIVKSENMGSGKIAFLPQTGAFQIPIAGQEPLQLTLPKGSNASFIAEKDALAITVSVKDDNIVSPKQFKPYTGDAVEIFIDCEPFYQMERDLIKGGKKRLAAYQYIIPAKPNKGETSCWINNKSVYKPKTSVKQTTDGYIVTFRLPWNAIISVNNAYRIYGIDIEIDHVGDSGKTDKETLGGKGGKSYSQRLHYPLFKVPNEINCIDTFETGELINGDFETQKANQNEPIGWHKTWSKDKSIYSYGNLGYNGSKGVGVKLVSSENSTRGWTQKFKCNPDGKTQLFISAMVKADDIRPKVNAYGAGLRFFCHFYDEVNKKHMRSIGIRAKEGIIGSFGWKKLQFVVDVPEKATRCQLTCGLSANATGTVCFDDVNVKTKRKETKMSIDMQRSSNNPLITPASGDIGKNVNGPFVIKVPVWCKNALGKYYMYFASHSGSFLRMAYADHPEGPWKVYEGGVLNKSQTGVAGFRGHIASPDVHVDEANKRIILFFHSPHPWPEKNNRMLTEFGQLTGIATSNDGLNFKVIGETAIAFSYLRGFFWKDRFYGLTARALVFKNDEPGWPDGSKTLIERKQPAGNWRHAALHQDGDTLYIFYTRWGDKPERIVVSTIDLSTGWENWQASPAVFLMKPATKDEGVNLPLIPSIKGSAQTPLNELRDPCYFQADGNEYLYYSIAGEAGISVATLPPDWNEKVKHALQIGDIDLPDCKQ